jgi:hypothetical protein
MAMHTALKKTAPIAALTLAAATLAGCLVEPAPHYGGDAYYARPAPVYLAPRYDTGPRWSTWPRHGWRGGGWHGGGHHWH